MKEEYLSSLYKNYTGHQPDKVEQLTGSGSNRQYFRLYGEKTLIGVYGESVEENKAFIYKRASEAQYEAWHACVLLDYRYFVAELLLCVFSDKQLPQC